MSEAYTVILPACFASATACMATFSAHCSSAFSKAISAESLTLCALHFLLFFLLELLVIQPLITNITN
jgi:hypothetical protein